MIEDQDRDKYAKLINEWSERRFSPPSPDFIKKACLARATSPSTTWIESGTYLGETARFLAGVSMRVYTIEPDKKLFRSAVQMLRGVHNVTLINGLSEEVFPKLLPSLQGDICFWLDGHYSGEGTYAGPNDTPLALELASIQESLQNWTRVSVLVDDIRLCGKKHSYGEYPSLDYLVDWARLNSMRWSIEQDIFVASV